jgi:hypothetical protein
MANKLSDLLAKDSTQRTVDDYERVCDDFVQFAGGARVITGFVVPEGTLNADYYFDCGPAEIVLELKQISAYRSQATIDQYFSDRLAEGKIKRFTKLPNGQIRIAPDSLSKSDWNHFYKRFRPSVSNDLQKAARQLRDTEQFLPPAAKRRVKGVILLNSGDFNLPTDLLHRLVEWKIKKEWRAGCFTSIDFVMCTTLDLFIGSQHPAHTRQIARTLEDSELCGAVMYLHNRWICYWAAAMGAVVDYQETDDLAEDRLDFSRPFAGKIRREA